MAEVNGEWVQVEIQYYRDCNGVVCERGSVEGKIVYDHKILYSHGLPPVVKFYAEPWPWEPEEGI